METDETVEEPQHTEARNTWAKKPVLLAVSAALVLSAIGGGIAYNSHLNTLHQEALSAYTAAHSAHTSAESDLNTLIRESEELLTDAKVAKYNPMLVEELEAALAQAKKPYPAPAALDLEASSTQDIHQGASDFDTSTAQIQQAKTALQESYDKIFTGFNAQQMSAALNEITNARAKAADVVGAARKLLADTENKVLDQATRTRLSEQNDKLIATKTRADELVTEKAKEYTNMAKEVMSVIPAVEKAITEVRTSHTEWLKKYQPDAAPAESATAAPSPQNTSATYEDTPAVSADTWNAPAPAPQAAPSPAPTPGPAPAPAPAPNTGSHSNGGWVETTEEVDTTLCYDWTLGKDPVPVPCQ